MEEIDEEEEESVMAVCFLLPKISSKWVVAKSNFLCVVAAKSVKCAPSMLARHSFSCCGLSSLSSPWEVALGYRQSFRSTIASLIVVVPRSVFS